MVETTDVTLNYFYDELKKRVSATNAKLLLHCALVNTGMTADMAAPLDKEATKTLCLELIKSGGPGFHVGRSIYTRWVQ
jgi:hypothetical protein